MNMKFEEQVITTKNQFCSWVITFIHNRGGKPGFKQQTHKPIPIGRLLITVIKSVQLLYRIKKSLPNKLQP